MKYFSFRLFILFLFANPVYAQQISNLQIFKNLSDSISNKIVETLPEGISILGFSHNYSNDLNILYDFIKAKLINSGMKITTESEYDEKLSLSFSDAKVEYKNLFKDHLFGNFFMTREITLFGSFILERKNKVFDFNLGFSDTVAFDNYTKLESKLYPITEGIPPKEPFFSNLIEPVIAIAATATAVVLFFTIRSK